MGFPYTIKRYGLIALLIVLPGFARAGNTEKVSAYTSVFKCNGGIWKKNYTDRHSILGDAYQAAVCQRKSLHTNTETHHGGAEPGGKKVLNVSHPEIKK